MDLNSRGVRLYVSRDSHGACAEMEARIGDLVRTCHTDNCPMGLFSCPLPCNCDEVTAETWAEALRLDRDYEDE